jgi:imidazolonepropionase-like amidohydrolase
MRLTILWRVAFGLVLFFGILAAAQEPSSSLLITGATLIDGTGAPPQPGSAVLIRDGKIAAVGKAGDLRAPAGVRPIRADGKFLLPGLWDSHIHYRWWQGEIMLHYGITTAVDLGSQLDWILAIREGIAKGKVRAPRLFSSGWILSGTPSPSRRAPRQLVPRIEAYQEYHSKENFPNNMRVLGGPEKMRAFVVGELDAGTDTLKVFPDMTREELRAITGAAHERGIPVVGHVDNAYHSIEDGLDGITHLHGIAQTLMTDQDRAEMRAGRLNTVYVGLHREKFDDLIQYMIQHNTFLGPCLIHDHAPVFGGVGDFEKDETRIFSQPDLAYLAEDTRLAMHDYLHMFRSEGGSKFGEFPVKEMLPPEVVQQYRQGYEEAKEFVRRFARAGGRLFTGTDMGGSSFVPGLIMHREMRVWVEEVGLTPMQAIVAATRNSAALIHKESILGTVETGKIADLVILTADPLANIRNTEKIEMVIKDGQIVDSTLHRDYSSPFREVGSEGAHNTSFAIPGIIGLTPRVVTAGAPDTPVVLEGSGLHMISKVFVDGEPMTSELEDRDHIAFTIPARLLARGGTKAITVVNRRPGGGTSKAYAFIVRFP